MATCVHLCHVTLSNCSYSLWMNFMEAGSKFSKNEIIIILYNWHKCSANNSVLCWQKALTTFSSSNGENSSWVSFLLHHPLNCCCSMNRNTQNFTGERFYFELINPAWVLVCDAIEWKCREINCRELSLFSQKLLFGVEGSKCDLKTVVYWIQIKTIIVLANRIKFW